MNSPIIKKQRGRPIGSRVLNKPERWELNYYSPDHGFVCGRFHDLRHIQENDILKEVFFNKDKFYQIQLGKMKHCKVNRIMK